MQATNKPLSGVRIGIPRTLWYFSYAPFWDRFFSALGARVVVSAPTTRSTLDAGVTTCVSEACLPIKAYFGHVMELAERVDYIFLPRLICLHEDRIYCPKFLGLPDMIRHAGMHLPKLLEVRLDRRKGPLWLIRACLELGRHLGAGRGPVFRAFLSARKEQAAYERRLRDGALPVGARPPRRKAPAGQDRPVSVALLGYPYLIYDDYLNLGLVEKLQAMGVRWRAVESVTGSALNRQKRAFPKRPFWHYSDMVARAGYHFIGPGAAEVEGVIHVTAFACGPDAMVDKILELEAEKQRRPYLNITLDEQSGEAGYITRLEAFVDMLRRREVTAGD